MKVFSEYREGRLTIYLHGELDHHEAKQSMALIDGLIERHLPRACVLDLGHLQVMDSSGIALMLKLSRRLGKAGGRLWVERAAGQPLRVIDASGIDRMIQITAGKEANV